jgi:hypothetical protein
LLKDSCALYVAFDEQEENARRSRNPRLVKRSVQGDDRRPVLTFRISARAGKSIDVDDVRESAVTENWSPRLKVAPEDFVFCAGMWREIPDSLFRRSHRFPVLGD